jgi:hypothetical protein
VGGCDSATKTVTEEGSPGGPARLGPRDARPPIVRIIAVTVPVAATDPKIPQEA